MVPQDYLTLRLIRLRLEEEWAHKTSGLALIFPKGGTGTYRTGAINHRLVPGDVLVADGGSDGRVCPSQGSEIVFWSFSVCPEHLFPLFAGSEISLLQSVIAGFKRAKVYPKSSPLTEGCYRILEEVSPLFDLDHRSQLLRVIASILTVEFKSAKAQRSGFVSAEGHMIQVFERLTSRELLTLSVGELAERFSCSRRHLNRLFHQHFGLSVASLRMEMRLLKAVSLLREPEAKVINIAEQCGFNHLGLFNTCFKRRFGSSPGQWRKQTLEAERHPAAGLNGAGPNCPLKKSGLCPLAGHPTSNGIGPSDIKAEGVALKGFSTSTHGVTVRAHRRAEVATFGHEKGTNSLETRA